MNNYSSSFISALQEENLDEIKKIPKSDKHCHAMLSCPLQCYFDWLKEPAPHLPPMFTSFEEFEKCISSIFSGERLNRTSFLFILENALKNFIDQGVTKLEMSLDCRLLYLFGNNIHDYISVLTATTRKFAPRIQFLPEIGLARDINPLQAEKLVLACIESNVFKSLDLYGSETARPPETYLKIVKTARKRGLKIKIHLGEYGDPQFMNHCINVLEMDEIQHGIRAVESRQTMEMIKNRKIKLNICPTSNI
ncbi:MAG: hypothetical protein EOM23_04250, partial [Candidatus Moranbacteria bacterium]|nr:hypothetical protein [Candidatus Moranbacteria bacterium]